MSDQKWLNLLQPRFRYGDIMPPGGGVRRDGYMFYRLVPMDVLNLQIGLGIKEYTPEGVDEAIQNFWPCVDALVADKADWLVLGGVPVSSQLGRPRVLDFQRQVKDKYGLHMDSPTEAVIAGLNHLGAKKITIASRWADQLNGRLTEYMQSGGIDVLHVTTRGQWGKQAFAMSLEDGLQMALDVGREAAKAAPEADAIFCPGGAALSIHVIPALEEEFGKPVLTNLNAEIWNALVRPGVIEPVKGWGKLLATR
jgi:maleate cis-trans isomerase